MKRHPLTVPVLVALTSLLVGCAASFAKQATRATGLCADRSVIVNELREQRDAVSWLAECENLQGLYFCSASDFDGDGSYDVTCEYKPICSKDGHRDTRTATVER